MLTFSYQISDPIPSDQLTLVDADAVSGFLVKEFDTPDAGWHTNTVSVESHLLCPAATLDGADSFKLELAFLRASNNSASTAIRLSFFHFEPVYLDGDFQFDTLLGDFVTNETLTLVFASICFVETKLVPITNTTNPSADVCNSVTDSRQQAFTPVVIANQTHGAITRSSIAVVDVAGSYAVCYKSAFDAFFRKQARIRVFDRANLTRGQLQSNLAWRNVHETAPFIVRAASGDSQHDHLVAKHIQFNAPAELETSIEHQSGIIGTLSLSYKLSGKTGDRVRLFLGGRVIHEKKLTADTKGRWTSFTRRLCSPSTSLALRIQGSRGVQQRSPANHAMHLHVGASNFRVDARLILPQQVSVTPPREELVSFSRINVEFALPPTATSCFSDGALLRTEASVNEDVMYFVKMSSSAFIPRHTTFGDTTLNAGWATCNGPGARIVSNLKLRPIPSDEFEDVTTTNNQVVLFTDTSVDSAGTYAVW